MIRSVCSAAISMSTVLPCSIIVKISGIWFTFVSLVCSAVGDERVSVRHPGGEVLIFAICSVG